MMMDISRHPQKQCKKFAYLISEDLGYRLGKRFQIAVVKYGYNKPTQQSWEIIFMRVHKLEKYLSQ